MNLIVVLLMFVAIGAVIAIWTKDLLSAVIAIGVVGFTRTVMFVLLRAPDVAITQVVVEVLLLIVLIRSTVTREVHTTEAWRGIQGAAVVTVFVLVLVVLGAFGFRQIAPFGRPVQGSVATNADRLAPRVSAKPGEPEAPSITYLRDGERQTGSRNIVTAVLMNYRAYDLLGAAAVVFTAAIGAVTLLRREGRRTETGGVEQVGPVGPVGQVGQVGRVEGGGSAEPEGAGGTVETAGPGSEGPEGI